MRPDGRSSERSRQRRGSYPTYKIKLSVHCPIHTTLKVYNVLGEVVKTLEDKSQGVGAYSVQWDGKNDLGEKLASGIYFYELKAGEITSSKKKVLLK